MLLFENTFFNSDPKQINVPYAEAKRDIDMVSSAYTKAEKVEIALKYNIQSAKIAEIQTGIYEYLRELRKRKKEFEKDDVSDFNRLTDASDYKKLAPYLDCETGVFIKYMMDTLKESLLSNPKRAGQYNMAIEGRIPVTMNYGFSVADQYRIKRYLSIKQYYEDHYGDNVMQHLNSQNITEMVNELLVEQTFETREYLLDSLSEFITNLYVNSEKSLPNLKANLDELKNNLHKATTIEEYNQYDEAMREALHKYGFAERIVYNYEFVKGKGYQNVKLNLDDILEKVSEEFSVIFDDRLMSKLTKIIVNDLDLDNAYDVNDILDEIEISEAEQTNDGETLFNQFKITCGARMRPLYIKLLFSIIKYYEYLNVKGVQRYKVEISRKLSNSIILK